MCPLSVRTFLTLSNDVRFSYVNKNKHQISQRSVYNMTTISHVKFLIFCRPVNSKI